MFNNLLWLNVEKYDTPEHATDDNIAQRMRFARWVTEATRTRSEYVILLLLHTDNGYGNAPHGYVCTHFACFFCHIN